MRVGVVAHIFHRGHILLIHRDKGPRISFSDTWDSVTEKLEKGEDFEVGMRRGLLEEINVVPVSLQMLGVTKAGHGFFFATLSKTERRKVLLGNEGQGMGFFGLGRVKDVSLGGALGFHLEAYPEAFRKMSGGVTPDPSELGLRVLVPAR